MKRYGIKEVFATIQGEGVQAGTPAVFVRFTGCNLWSGHDRTRARDAEDSGAACPTWCDTDFRKGTRPLTAGEVVEAIERAAVEAGMPTVPLVVFTGGEPALQLDAPLLDDVRSTRLTRSAVRCIETNGSVELARQVERRLEWVCVSPKLLPHRIKQRHGNELKIPHPGALIEPDAYRDELPMFDHYILTPRADALEVGRSVIVSDRIRQCAEYAQRHQGWRVSLQMHKHGGLR